MRKTALIVLGASGNLAKLKLAPAINGLFNTGQLDSSCVLIGSGRTLFSDEEFRDYFHIDADFRHQCFYHQGIAGLKSYLQDKGDFDRYLFFFSLPPSAYITRAQELHTEGFTTDTNLVIEKPFGYDLDSAIALNSGLLELYSEKQIYRIDHYLAKEAVQNIMTLRFENSVFEPLLNNKYVQSIEITAFETIGVEDRAAYFDSAGILRDMVQNHLTQIMSLLMMDVPCSLRDDDVRTAKAKVLHQLEYKQCYRSQYLGYRQEPDVAPQSDTETYAELELAVNSPRWLGVPVYVRTGKATNRKIIEIVIHMIPFTTSPCYADDLPGDIPPSNQLILRVQPHPSIRINHHISSQTDAQGLVRSAMSTAYTRAEKEVLSPYQILLAQALDMNQTSFVSSVETETAWQKIQHLLDKGQLSYYEKGTTPPTQLGINWYENQH